MNPNEWKAFINHLFVNADGSRKAALLKLTIEADGNTLNLPELSVAHTDTLQQVFIKVDQLLKSIPAKATSEPTEAEQKIKSVNVEHIKSGNTEYIVHRMSDDSFQVQKLDGEIVTPKTIVYNKVVKKYREQFKLD